MINSANEGSHLISGLSDRRITEIQSDKIKELRFYDRSNFDELEDIDFDCNNVFIACNREGKTTHHKVTDVEAIFDDDAMEEYRIFTVDRYIVRVEDAAYDGVSKLIHVTCKSKYFKPGSHSAHFSRVKLENIDD